MGKKFFAVAMFLATSSIGQLVPGANSPQVAVLQSILNQNPATIVAQSGPGSAGQETDYFGPATLAALRRFQSLYAQNILVPLGLSTPTGFLGLLTLEKLNEIVATETLNPIAPSVIFSASSDSLAAYRVATNTVDIYVTDSKIIQIQNEIYSSVNSALAARQAPQINTSNDQGISASAVIMTGVSVQSGLPGSPVNITAQNLDTGPANDVYFAADPGGVAETTGIASPSAAMFVIKNLAPQAGSLSFALPSFPSGRYDIAISNDHGISNTAFFVVTPVAHSAVAVSAVSPSAVRWGGTLTISGSGFMPTGNEVFTTFDTIPNVSSPDGRTLTVKITPEQMRAEAALGTGTIAVPDQISVVNDNGYSPTIQSFSVNI